MDQLYLESIVTVITAIIGAVGAFAIARLNASARWQSTKTKQADVALLETIATHAVSAAREVGRDRGLDGAGMLASATRRVEEYAEQYGATWSDAQIDTAIHKIVDSLKHVVAAGTSANPIQVDADIT